MILLKKSTLTLYNLTCTYENNNRPNIMFPSKSFNFYPKLYFIISKMEIFQEIKLYGIFSINCYNRLTIQIIYSRFKILKYNFSLTTYNVFNLRPTLFTSVDAHELRISWNRSFQL